MPSPMSHSLPRRWMIVIASSCIGTGVIWASIINLTLEDFHLSGTQVAEVGTDVIATSSYCGFCHEVLSGNPADNANPHVSWSGSLMAQAGRDPLFFAQMTAANQDVANAGYFCMRCHVPMSFVTAHAYDVDGSSLDDYDRDGVNCHFCHSMVDPIYKPGISPPEDQAILEALNFVPGHYANAMFVLDPAGQRRGSRADVAPPHEFIHSPFHATGEFCGTCHDVGNVAVTRQADGTYRYNAIDQPTPSEDPHTQFPLERTFTEWKLSAFANGGVDMGGRFGGVGGPVVSSCQDCHMPRRAAWTCVYGPEREDVASHDFAGASAWVLEIIGLYTQGDPSVSQEALQVGRNKAVDMLQRAASLQVSQQCDSLRVRVTNESGHKLPTGHIEGRRVWLNVKIFDAADNLIEEYGHYDHAEAHLDEPSTKVYEMHVGLSKFAASATGYPAGVTTHMALADTIVKDNRIPPRGFSNAAYEAGGAPPVAAQYADGQYWDDTNFDLPRGAARALVTVNYQTVTRHYIEALRDANVTDDWGNILHDLWLQTDKAPPIPMQAAEITIVAPRVADVNCDGLVNISDLLTVVLSWGTPGLGHPADVNGDGAINMDDLLIVINDWD